MKRRKTGPPDPSPPHKAGDVLDVAIRANRQRAVRCQVLGASNQLTLRTPDHWRLVPGEIARVTVTKCWTYDGFGYISGKIVNVRLDVAALGLVPLSLQDHGMWDPADYDAGEEEELAGSHARGPRRAFEMQQVLPGADPDDPDDDPILRAIEFQDAGADEEARRELMNVLVEDLRCLDAHAHLGNFALRQFPEQALRHYEIGLRIGELSLPRGFDGVLPWGAIDNRPFLRCHQGYGLALWKLGRFEEAAATLDRLLDLNPGDHQGARFEVEEVRVRHPWQDSAEVTET